MNHLFASLMFFTRLPWWRLRTVPKEAFEHVVDWWPLIGWLTGGVMAAVFVMAVSVGMFVSVAALLAIASRLLLTGALHEDGLADFFDGFGGGTDRARTLFIMKDSHIGTYGVLGLLLVLGLLWASLVQLSGYMSAPGSVAVFTPSADALLRTASVMLLFDVAAKSAASLITGQLPYARTADEAKNKVVYVGRSLQGWLCHGVRCALALSLPVAACCYFGVPQVHLLLPVPFVLECLLMLWMRRRIGGYTGDCCGAIFLLCELSLYLTCGIALS